MASCEALEKCGVEQMLESLRGVLLGELQAMRDTVGAMEEKMDTLILDRLLEQEAAVCGKASSGLAHACMLTGCMPCMLRA